MPADFWTVTVGMLTAGAIVAAVAVPVSLVAWAMAGRRRGLCAKVAPWRVPWGGFELIAAFVVLISLPALFAPADASEQRKLEAGVLTLPVQLGLLVLAWRVLYPRWKPFTASRSYAGLLAFAVLAWLILTSVVFLFHAAVLQAFAAFDVTPETHPLTKFDGQPFAEQLCFLLQACVAAPFVEELLFRGLLLPWAIGARERTPGGFGASEPLAPVFLRPWLVMGMAVFFAAGTGKPGPMIFAGALGLGLAVVWVTLRHGKRHWRGVYASAALFATFHSSVWPSPIPLFVLGVGLGWLAMRTRGVFVPVIVHGLFNAVSAVFVLRGAG